MACVVLGALAGPQLGKPSANNHFVHMAHGWFEGRLHHEGKPPGYCEPRDLAAGRCRGHRFDDWAVVWTLHLRDGSEVRGFPCRTEACAEIRRTEREDTWWVLGRGWVRLPRGAVARAEDTWYVSFPPGPAVVMAPVVAFWGLDTLDVLLTVIAAACIPVLLLRLLDRERGIEQGRGLQHLWAVAAWTFASPALFLGAHGRVWFTAQIFGALFLVAYLSAAWTLRRPGWAGLWLGLAVACRPTMALAVVFFGWQWWQRGRRVGAASWFVALLSLVAALLMWHNAVRFDDPLEFGHRFLDIRWQARIQEVGLFSWQYVPRNLHCLLWLMPMVSVSAPFVAVSIHGTALWLTTPWLLTVVRARTQFEQRVGLWTSAAAVAVPPLLYQNSGQLQFTYRFAVDWLPMVLLALVFGGAARRRVFAVLVILGALVQGYGAYFFARAPARLFVTDPPGWPF